MSNAAVLLVADSLMSVRTSFVDAKTLEVMKAAGARLREWERRYAAASSEATLRALRSDWHVYIAWCEKMDLIPLPMPSPTLIQFVRDMVSEGRKRATIDRYIWAVREVHKAAGFPDPTQHPDWRLEFKAVVRVLAKLKRNGRKQAEPLKFEGVQAIIETIEGDLPEPRSSLVRLRRLRDAALIALASDTLCRESELVVVSLDDIQPSSDGAYSLRVNQSKNDQEAKGSFRYVSPETKELIDRWCAAAQIEKGFIFLPVGGRKKSTPGAMPHLRPLEVARIIRRRATQSGVENGEKMSGHSTRVGSAIDLIDGGESYTATAYAGGWKSEAMVRQYAQQAEAGINAMSRVRRHQRKPRQTEEQGQ